MTAEIKEAVAFIERLYERGYRLADFSIPYPDTRIDVRCIGCGDAARVAVDAPRLCIGCRAKARVCSARTTSATEGRAGGHPGTHRPPSGGGVPA